MAPSKKTKLPSGTVLGGKFRVTREIGRGGMATVYEAENVDIGKRVAVKILATEFTTSRTVTERFLREARAAASVRSPYICEVYDAGSFEDRPFLVLEFLAGESLYERLSHKRRLDTTDTLRVITQTAKGLAKAHDQNIVHRDLKPENIFLATNEEGEEVAKLVDFGLAKFYEPANEGGEQARLTREGALFGTPAYMSPEQARAQGEVDLRTDLWALACITYECLTGKTVWNVEQGVAMILAQIAGAPIPRPTRLRPDLPRAFDDWFLKALERDPDKRFQTAREFAASLAVALDPNASTGTRRDAPLHSAEEAAVLDSFIDEKAPPAPFPSRADSPGDGLPQPEVPHSSRPSPDGAIDLTLDEPVRSGPGRAIGALFLVAALSIGGYAGWLYWSGRNRTPTAVPSASAPVASASAGPDLEDTAMEPLEKEPFALQISSAQKRLAKGERADALTMFREAFNNGGSRVARSVLSLAGAALTDEGTCRVESLGRPRPFDLVEPVSRPSLALTPNGLLAVWADNHDDAKRKQAYAVRIDPLIRRVSQARLLTPEARSVRHPQLIGGAENAALLYWDEGGKQPAVYARLIHLDGRIAGPARQVSDVKRHEFNPAMTRLGDGGYFVVWSERLDGSVNEDLVGRRLDADLKPVGDVVRLTDHVGKGRSTTKAERPDVTSAHGYLYVVYAKERDRKREIRLLRVKLDSKELREGLAKPGTTKPAQGGDEDRTIGSLHPVSSGVTKANQPRIACVPEGCFVVWDDEAGGAHVAYVEKSNGEPIWRRNTADRGRRPGVASAPKSGAVMAWYEGSRVKLAKLTRDAVAEPSVVGRIQGYQPYPVILPGRDADQWYLSWRDYESGHLEAFVVGVKCGFEPAPKDN